MTLDRGARIIVAVGMAIALLLDLILAAYDIIVNKTVPLWELLAVLLLVVGLALWLRQK